MSADIRELLAEIKHQQNEAYNNISDDIICMEAKNELMDPNYECGYIVQEGRIFDEDGDEVFFIDDSIFTEAVSGVKGKAQYDFKGNKASVGTDNYDVAKILKDIFVMSKRFHGTETQDSKKSIYGTSKAVSNFAKYQKTADLLNKLNDSTTQQNFCKVYYATPDVGKIQGRPCYVFFAEIELPTGTYYFSWHLQKDGMNSNNTKKKSTKNSLCDKIDKITPNGRNVIKYGNKKVSEYAAMEKKYSNEVNNRRNGSVVMNELCTSFGFQKI